MKPTSGDLSPPEGIPHAWKDEEAERMWWMATEREIHDIVACCVALMSGHDASGKVPSTTEMVAGIQSLAGRANRLHVAFDRLDMQILQPVRAELVARFSPATAHSIYATFLRAFEEGYIFNSIRQKRP